MSKDRYSYVAIFSYGVDGIFIEFPDLPGCYSRAGKDDTDGALTKARKALRRHIWRMEQCGETIPTATPITSLTLGVCQIPMLIDVIMPPVTERLNDKFLENSCIGTSLKIPWL